LLKNDIKLIANNSLSAGFMVRKTWGRAKLPKYLSTRENLLEIKVK